MSQRRREGRRGRAAGAGGGLGCRGPRQGDDLAVRADRHVLDVSHGHGARFAACLEVEEHQLLAGGAHELGSDTHGAGRPRAQGVLPGHGALGDVERADQGAPRRVDDESDPAAAVGRAPVAREELTLSGGQPPVPLPVGVDLAERLGPPLGRRRGQRRHQSIGARSALGETHHHGRRGRLSRGARLARCGGRGDPRRRPRGAPTGRTGLRGAARRQAAPRPRGRPPPHGTS